MKDFLAAIHALPEDARKFFAGLTIVILGIGFFAFWTSFMSSRLVALGPPAKQNAAAGDTAPVARRLSPTEIAERRRAPTSPAAGIAGSVSDAGRFFAATQREADGSPARSIGIFFASVGQGLAAVAEAIYMKMALWVPPYP